MRQDSGGRPATAVTGTTGTTGTTAAGGAVLALLGATLLWSGNYVVGGAAVATFSPLELTAARWAIAVVPLLVLAQVVERPDWRAAARDWPRVVPAALLGLVAYNLLLYGALQHISAAEASLVNAFNPALICIAAALFLGQSLSAPAVGGVLLALVGVLWVLSDGDPAALVATGPGGGNLLMVGAIVAWTAYTLLGRRNTGIPPLTSTALQAVVAVVVLVPVVLAGGGFVMPHMGALVDGVGGGALWALVFIGVGPSVVSYVLWNGAVRRVPAATAGVFLNLITVFTVLVSTLMGRVSTGAELVGGGVVLVGVVMAGLPRLSRTGALSKTRADEE